MKRLWLLGFLFLNLVGGSVEAASMIIKGKPATFRATARGGETFEWVFPGNVKINGEVVRYTFREDGPQNVTLRVIAPSGETNELTKSVMVHNFDKPTASIEARVDNVTIPGAVIRAELGQKIDLKSRPFGGAGIDSGAFETTWRVNGREYSESQVTSVFNRVGTYQVTLTIQDPDKPHLQDQDNLKVVIENQPPVVKSLTYKAASKVPGQINVIAEAEDPDGHVISYKFEVLEQGRLFVSQVVKESTAYFDLSRYPGSHTYSFRVTITDDRYATDTFDSSESFAFERESFNTPPEVSLNAVPGNQGDTDTMFTFFAEASDKDKDFLKYEWRLNDGRRFYAPQFQYRFTEPGDQTIALKVSDGIATVEDSLVVSVVPKEVITKENLPPTIKLRGILPSQKADVNTVFRFYLTAKDPEGDNLEYSWDMGDGGKMFIQNPAYRYKKPGKYKVKMKVSDGVNEVQGIADVIVDRIEQEKPPTLEEEALAKEVEQLKAKTEALKKVKIAAPADTSSIEEKISTLSIQAEEAKKLAEQKQAAAKSIAEKERERLQAEQAALMERLRETQEERARIALENQLAAAEKNLEMLAKAAAAQAEEKPLNNNAEVDLLKAELEALKLKIIAEQKAFINEKITALKEDQAKETDREKKFALGLEIQTLERYKASTDLLGEFATEYKESLINRKSGLETQLSEASDDQSKILIQGQISTVEAQLLNLDRFEEIRLDLARSQLSGTSSFANDDQAEFQQYIQNRIGNLVSEKNEIKQALLTETDSLQIEVYKARLAEIESLLQELGYATEQKLDVDQVLLVTAKKQIAEHANLSSASANAEEDPDRAERMRKKAEDLKAQLASLQTLDKSGLSPDMTVYDLRDELLTKKEEIVNEFRAEKDIENLEKLRSKVTVLDKSLKILEGLELSGVTEDDTLERAQNVLSGTRLNLTRRYVSESDNAKKPALLARIQTVTREQQLLAKFYDPQARLVTIGSVKRDLDDEYALASEKEREAVTNDQKLFYKNELEALDFQKIMIKRIENSLREIIRIDFEAQIDEYKANLLAELEGITNEEERARLQAEIDNLDVDALKTAGLGQKNYFQGLIADMVISVNTKLFLYGQTPSEHDQAVFFEWDLDDGRVLTGQNIDFTYRDPGFYRVKLKISDGLTETQDSLTIKVMPESEDPSEEESLTEDTE